MGAIFPPTQALGGLRGSQARLRRCVQLHLLVLLLAAAQKPDGLQSSMETYAPKSCKYNPIPSSLSTRAYKAYTGEVNVHDVFGLPSTSKRHVVQLDVSSASLLTLQAEVHRDTPATLAVDAYRRGEVGKPSGRVLFGRNLLGAGGDDTKAFLHGLLSEKELAIDLVFELVTVEVAASQVDARVAEARCWPVRLDITAVPTSRAALHWPTACAEQNRLPPGPHDRAGGNQVVVLTEKGLTLEPSSSPDAHYTFRFGDERPWAGFERSLWSGTLEVPPRLHRFVRFFFRASFRFASGPLQLVIELFDLKDVPDGAALVPKCAMGCLGGVPVFNGQVIDHAMPTGFRYRLWLLAANLVEWTGVITEPGRQCLEFDLDYSIRFEERLTPFEVGPAAWLCESTRLPNRIIQSPRPLSTDKLGGGDQLVAGRSIWIRDRFGFPPDEVADMEHKVELEVSEPCIFRATTHHSDGVDVFIALTRKGETQRACKSLKHPGPVPRQTIFCMLQPGSYTVTFFADYPLGGLHPCSDFFAQIALRPTGLASEDKTKQCLASASDLSSLQVQRSLALTTVPRWKSIKVPITFDSAPAIVSVWRGELSISDVDAAQRLYLRLVLHSDYVSSDLRFQVRYEGRYVADTQVTAHGYADMIGPLDPGSYTVEMYYVSGTGAPKDTKLCSTSMVDLRVVSRSAYGSGNTTANWLCTSTRVPAPDLLAPQSDEQVLIDSEYVVPDSGTHVIRLKLGEARVVRLTTTSADAEFQVELWTRGASEALVARGSDSLEVLVNQGLYSLRLKATVRGSGGTSTCSTFLLNLLLQPLESLPACPWSPSSSDQSAAAQAQKAAADHIGDVLLDLVPQKLTKEVKVKPAVSLWMSQGMEKTFEMAVDSTAAIRIDVAVQPPFLPLQVEVRRKRESGKLEAPLAAAEWTESRLLLLDSDLPKGTYVIQFRMPRKYALQPGSSFTDDALANLCAHVTIYAEVGIASKEAVNTMRSELLDLPDLLAVQPLLPSLNTVGWFSSALLPVVGTQVYRFKEGAAKTALKVTEDAILRVVCEPADLSNADIEAVLEQNGAVITRSDNLGQLVAEVHPGTYQVTLKPKASAPFLVTFGVATQSRLREDFALQDSGKPCLDKFPAITGGVDFSRRGWTLGPVFVRLKSSFLSMEGPLTKVPIVLKVASVLYIEAGSLLPLDLVRIALQVPEGLWVGEQRGARNSLEIELPPGKYAVHIAQPKPIRMEAIQRCLDFSVMIRATPISPDAKADAVAELAAAAASDGAGAAAAGDAEKSRQELAPREEASVEAAPCFAMGTVPLPLDLSDPAGGSLILGGPLDKDGRLLVRTRAMLTDMHDGRKKVYLQAGGKQLQLKVGVMLGGHARFSLASQLSFSVQPVGGRTALEPVEVWSSPDGWERIYLLDGSGFWLSFHHGHRERAESACLHFGLEIEAHPVADVPRMMQCGGSSSSPEDIFPNSLDLGQSTDSKKVFRYSKTPTLISQRQRGFLTKTRFTLATQSFVYAEVGYNFFISHAEMDIVPARDDRTSTALVTAELDFLNPPSEQLNTRLVVGHTLPPGEYVLRVADDHYSNQLGGDTQCFPFSFELRVVPAAAAPTVVSVQPHPSVPIPRGVDLVLTIRFSEAPEGQLEDVVKKISLGGVQASTGGSLNAMEGRFASAKRRSTVQATTAEGHLVWVIGWSAESLAEMGEAKLKLGALRTNQTKRLFYFNPPTYTFVEAPRSTPWSGGAASSQSTDAPAAATAAPAASADASGAVTSMESAPSAPADVGAPRAESSGGGPAARPASGADAGEVHVEGTNSAPSDPGAQVGVVGGSGAPPAAAAVADAADDDDDDDHAPRVQRWAPMDSAPVRPGGRDAAAAAALDNPDDCPDGGVRSAASGLCEGASFRTSRPLAYQAIVVCSGVALGAFLIFFCCPELRKPSGGRGPNVKARFRDIGQRSSEEEIGLVQAANRDEDDDML